MLQSDSSLDTIKQDTARLSIISNTSLVALKLVVGYMTGAVSIISEAAHSAVDLLAAIIAFYAVRQSDQPPDKNHAYGHGKIENVSGAVEAVLIIAAAVGIIYESVQKLNSGVQPEFLEYGIGVMIVSIVVNYWVSKRLLTVAKATHSHALEADGLHLQADIWTSVGVLGGLIVIKVTGLVWLDPFIAMLVALIVFKAGYSMTKKSVHELTDVSLPVEEEAEIGRIVANHPEVISFHRLRTRRSGSCRQIDMHLILHKNMHLDKAHAVCDSIEHEIESRLGSCDVVIHMEPCDYHEDSACPLLADKEESS